MRHLLSLAALFLAFDAAAALNVCHVSSYLGSKLPSAKDKELLFGSFELAARNTELRLHKFEPKDSLDVLKGIEWAQARKCRIVVGLISSQDALLAAPLLAQHGMFGVSATATTHLTNRWHENFRSLSVSSEQYVQDLVQELKLRERNEFFVVTKKGSPYSDTYEGLLRAQELPGARYVDLAGATELLKHKSRALIVFTAYPFESLPVMLKLPKAQDFLFVGTPAWNETHTMGPFKDELHSRGRILVLDPMRTGAAFTEFVHAYEKAFGRRPDHDSIYEFDVIRFIAGCAKPSEHDTLKCLREKKSFTGATGPYQFVAGKSHPVRAQVRKFLLEVP